MLKAAIKAGHSAKYVLFDTWFANPKDIIRIHHECGLNTIAMIKKSSKVFYEFEEKRMNVKQIFGMCKKRRGRSKYLLSVTVNISLKSGESLLAKSCVFGTETRRKTGLPSSAQTPICQRKRYFVSMGNAGMSRSFSRLANPC